MFRPFGHSARPAADPPPDPPAEVLFSKDALQRAWRMTRLNGGSPGVDHVTLAQFEQRAEQELRRLRRDLLDGAYAPHPVQRYYKTKASGKKRALSIWTVRDRVAQRVILEYITPILEKRYLPCSFGFRPGRTVSQAVDAVRDGLRRGQHWVVDADITDCFDSVPVPPLLGRVREYIPSARAVALIEGWLKTPIAGQPGVIAGVSQGAVISPQLTNLYLHHFDRTITALLLGASLVRFADDFVILCGTRMGAQGGLLLARQTLAGMALTLNAAKTRIVHLRDGFTFLGVTLTLASLSRSPLDGGTTP
jgi:group II intron reverse transcriptase/maturase